MVTLATEHSIGIDANDRSEAVVEVKNVSRRFGEKVALDSVNFRVPAGSVVGLVGENGAGKTTLIRHILGLLKPQSGSVSVFGLDPIAEPVRVLSRLGYLSEEPDIPGWMRVHELLRYVAAFYKTWDAQYAEQLRVQFGLDPMTKVKQLSKGQRARAGLICALAYRPELLVLDEPSSGLDPIVRRDILGAIVRTIANEGRTVLFSSHLLSEVEQISDRVAMIRTGKILFCDSMDRIKQSHTRVTFRFDDAFSSPPALEGALSWDGSGHEWSVVCACPVERIEMEASQLRGRIVERAPLSLEQIFVARTNAVDQEG
jgi:ABC-2 type transport system ATP-binding protein